MLLVLAGAEARAQPALELSRRCQEPPRADSVSACREVLRLGLPPVRAIALRRVLASTLVSLGRGREAVDVYREGAAQNPEDPEARLRLGRALLLLDGDAGEAAAELQVVLRLSPERAEAYALLGSALLRLGQLPESAAAFAEAERIDPSFFELRPASRLEYEAAKGGQAWP
jgi:cytochrome c-type biogenesis protein CcmH/NrfG